MLAICDIGIFTEVQRYRGVQKTSQFIILIGSQTIEVGFDYGMIRKHGELRGCQNIQHIEILH